MGGFDNAKIVKINNKEVDSIKTNDGTIIYQRPVIATVNGSSVQLGYPGTQWLVTNGNVIVDWGDETQSTVNNPNQKLNHTYNDGKLNHNITFLRTVTSLGSGCFYNYAGLTSVIIPSSVTSLGRDCFYNCTGLASITIPSSVTSLGDGCFRECTNLTNYQLYWTGNNIITYDSNKMPNNTNTKFYVPSGQKTNYVNKGYPSAKVIERSS